MIPPFLKPGDTIGIAATARWISPEELHPALDLFHAWGFKTKCAANLHKQYFQLAGDDLTRTMEMQRLLDDADVKAIIVARGGYGTVHLIDQLDFTTFMKFPKWICGYSDVTVLHAFLNCNNVASIHCTMPYSFLSATQEALSSLQMALTGNLPDISWQPLNHNLSDSSPHLPVNGRLMGGNLSVLHSLLGSSSLSYGEDFILFIEDVDEMLYHVDRMLMAMLRSGLLHRAKAILLGGMTQMRDNTRDYGFPKDNPWGKNALEIVHSLALNLEIPVFNGFPAGHQSDNRAFYLGRQVNLISRGEQVRLEF